MQITVSPRWRWRRGSFRRGSPWRWSGPGLRGMKAGLCCCLWKRLICLPSWTFFQTTSQNLKYKENERCKNSCSWTALQKIEIIHMIQNLHLWINKYCLCFNFLNTLSFEFNESNLPLKVFPSFLNESEYVNVTFESNQFQVLELHWMRKGLKDLDQHERCNVLQAEKY